MPMLDRVEVNAIDMAGEIAVIADGMLPEPTLPDASLTLVNPACGAAFFMWNAGRKP